MVPPAPTEPAMITDALAAGVPATSVNASGLSVPSLPAAITTTIPAAVARPIAACRLAGMAEPPSDILMTFAPAARAASTPAVIASVGNLHALSLSLVAAAAQVPGRSARSAITVASKATPCVPVPLRRPAAVKATAVPWPLSSSTLALPPNACDADETRLSNSADCRSMPVSMMPMPIPLPVAAAL